MVAGRSKDPGYIMHVLTIAGAKIGFYAHKMVAELFIPNPENKPQVNHENLDKLDNRAKNLEWATNQENAQHAFEHGHSGQGETHYNAKLSAADVQYIRDMYTIGTSQAGLAAEFGVSHTTISRIVNWQRRKRG